MKKCIINLIRRPNINKFWLWINDRINEKLKRKIGRSFRIRSFLYGEGVYRLSEDHDISLYYRWPRGESDFWAVQPSFNSAALKMFEENNVIELGCGNGWFLRNFYCNYAKLKYYGYDLSEDIIMEAKRKLSLEEKRRKRNIEAVFAVADIAEDITVYDEDTTNIFWYASINMFDKTTREKIMYYCSKSLSARGGILSGSADVVVRGMEQWDKYISLYEDEEELRTELEKYFMYVYISPNKQNGAMRLFMASNAALPYYNSVPDNEKQLLVSDNRSHSYNKCCVKI